MPQLSCNIRKSILEYCAKLVYSNSRDLVDNPLTDKFNKKLKHNIRKSLKVLFQVYSLLLTKYIGFCWVDHIKNILKI